ncbi:flagellar biosynthetic protein FliR [Aliiruegeria sabulilitoris]|uniref:flagellar biosynthetic protein FliR n=1 Tax=Aliiruegeria sabulilitoris TaxID=1510458 RepID=UPI0008306A03|nr:flagellar biosynthetic protein FliR [Aliiruegeria sabulilitoris]NDR58540.1 type III secretion protein [Pseudoruegeria sp. M32A2M]
MIELPPELLQASQSLLLQGVVAFLRVAGVVAFLPAFGEKLVPQRVKLAVALAFTLIVLPAVPPTDAPATGTELLTLIGAETLIGVVLGLTLRMMVVVLQMAASMIAQSTSLAQIFSGSATEPMPAIGHVLVMGGLALAVMADLHVFAAKAIMESYSVFPVGKLVDSTDLAEFGIAHISYCFRLAFCLAAPFVLAAFIYNLALGAINRAMPQLMVVLVGAPAITGVGMAMLAMLSPFLLQIWLDAFQLVLADPFGMR